MASPSLAPVPTVRRTVDNSISGATSNELVLKMQKQMWDFYSSYHAKTKCCCSSIKIDKPLQKIDLLLIGKTGNGKSALGNSILGRDAFESRSTLDSVTKNVTFDSREYKDFAIKVVDGPGVGDTRLDNEKAIDLVLNAISTAISVNPRGYHAFLLVLKFGSRLTAEDQDTIVFLKRVFGEFFFNKFCIIVMTYGDLFSEDVTFEEWVAGQKCGIFPELVKECNKRIILFDNKTKDPTKKQKQLDDLLNLIENVKSDNCRYADEHFKSAQDERDALLLEAEKEIISEDIMTEANMIYLKFQEIINTIEPLFSTRYLEELSERVNALYERIEEKDKGSKVLQQLLSHVNSLRSSITDEIKLSKVTAEEREKYRKMMEDEALSHAALLQIQIEEHSIALGEDKAKGRILEEQVKSMKEKEEELQKKLNDLETELKGKRKDVKEVGKGLKQMQEEQIDKMQKKMKKGFLAKMKAALHIHKKK